MKKQCSTCLEFKGVSEFHVRKASPDGRAYKCRCCVNEYTRAWNIRNAGAHKIWYAENKDHKSAYFKNWRFKNKEHVKASLKLWAVANKPKINALVAKRAAAKKRALVPWINHDAVAEIYAKAELKTLSTGVRHEVDHIVPLQGKCVSGLHWEHNLQVLTKEENIRKLNHFDAGSAA